MRGGGSTGKAPLPGAEGSGPRPDLGHGGGLVYRGESDVTSEYVYVRKLCLKARPDRPLVLSEFGGYSCKIPGHAFNLDKTYGYKNFHDLPSFRAGLERLYR